MRTMSVEKMTEWLDSFEPCEDAHDVLTVQLRELVQAGIFSWKRDALKWDDVLTDTATYKRLCDYFVNRFYFREISVLPYARWEQMLGTRIRYEVAPKYLKLAKQYEELTLISSEDEWYKEREIGSEYPETLLSGNSDYISTGKDKEYERIKIENPANAVMSAYKVVPLDVWFCDQLESMFTSVYTVDIAGR